MKKINRYQITALCFLVCIFFFGFKTLWPNLRPILSESLAPLRQEGSLVSRAYHSFLTLIQKTDDASVDSFYERQSFIDFHGLAQRVMGRRTVEDPGQGLIVKDSQGKLSWLPTVQDTGTCAQRVVELERFCRERDTEFLYFAAPFKFLPGLTGLPPSIEDQANPNLDRFLAVLEASGVPYLDFRTQLETLPYAQEDLFFNTDHHWRIETAFEAFRSVAGVLTEKGLLNPAPESTDLGAYQVSTYPQFSLGSQGRRVGRFYAGLDDFTLITPAFDTDYTVTVDVWGEYQTRTGSFDEAILNQDYLDPEKPPETVRYAAYFGGDYPETIIENHLAESGNLLVIQDSFGLPFSAFLSTATKNLTLLDLRYFKGSLFDYIEQHQPDAVLFCYNPDVFFDPMFSFEAH